MRYGLLRPCESTTAIKEVCQVKIIQKYEATGDSYTSSYFPYEGVLTRKFKLGGKLETEVEILSVNLTTEWGPYSSGLHLSDPPVMKSFVLALYPRLISGPRRRFGNPVWKHRHLDFLHDNFY